MGHHHEGESKRGRRIRLTLSVAARRREDHLASGVVDCVCELTDTYFAKRTLGCGCRKARKGRPRVAAGMCCIGERERIYEWRLEDRLMRDVVRSGRDVCEEPGARRWPSGRSGEVRPWVIEVRELDRAGGPYGGWHEGGLVSASTEVAERLISSFLSTDLGLEKLAMGPTVRTRVSYRHRWRRDCRSRGSPIFGGLGRLDEVLGSRPDLRGFGLNVLVSTLLCEGMGAEYERCPVVLSDARAGVRLGGASGVVGAEPPVLVKVVENKCLRVQERVP